MVPILSNAELARERAVLAHLEADVRVAAMARRRTARIAEKAAYRANLGPSRSIADVPVPSR